MRAEYIDIRGVRVHNLQNISLKIPKNTLTVITGLSGSGKSSLAFDTIYAEGQRRYVESLSAYARQFLGLMEKPDCDLIEGLSPAIAIEQHGLSNNPRSTVATTTEIYDYLRLLYARLGQGYCYKCGRPIVASTVQEIVDALLAMPEGEVITLMAPVVRRQKGTQAKLLAKLQSQGFARLRIDGEIYNLEDNISLEKNNFHNIDVQIDRIKIRPGVKERLSESVELALNLAGGLIVVQHQDGREELMSEHASCPDCHISLPEFTPALFSFNNPQGACPDCLGLGFRLEFDPALILKNPDLSVAAGAIEGWTGRPYNYYYQLIYEVFRHYEVDFNTPWKELPADFRKILLYGSGAEFIRFELRSEHMEHSYIRPFEGIIPNMERRYNESTSEAVKQDLAKYQREIPCERCHGTRLKEEARAVRIKDLAIHELTAMSIEKMADFMQKLDFTGGAAVIAKPICKEINKRLSFLRDVGLSYLTLDRMSATLSGGEAQRIMLATQIGSALTGVIYVLDEPSIGLHPRDSDRLINTLKKLRDLGNTVIVVEHDEAMMRAADFIVDLGPGAGRNGGRLMGAGPLAEIIKGDSLTAAFLSGREKVEFSAKRRKPKGFIEIKGASHHNLKNIDVKIPLGIFTAVTGVSGSGKSSLINDTLYPALMHHFYDSTMPVGSHKALSGLEQLDKVVAIDQDPIGRTPRSNPATYTGLFSLIRDLFAGLPESKARGYGPGRYSFNVKGGRCEHCQGDGLIKIAMHFLPDVYVPCEVCHGTRYNRETLEITYRGKSIADILAMTVDEALEFFTTQQSIVNKLKTLHDVGLGYVQLGQSATTLSGGEAQRIKLSKELSRRATGKTIYILDEPTTGLHFADVRNLINVLQRLVSNGNSVVVIEHNLDVIKSADYIIDLGPEGGAGGGQLNDFGTPEGIARHKKCHTADYLAELLGK